MCLIQCLLGASPPVPFSGKVSIDSVNYHGQAKFAFAIRDKDGAIHWRNGNQNDSTIDVSVTNGRYIVLLGYGGPSIWTTWDGTLTNRNFPMQVLSSGPADVSCGSFSTYLRMSDGSMRVMGKDNDGMLGLGRAVKHTSPVQVATGMPAP